MRDWLLVVGLLIALVTWIAVELLPPQLGSVPTDLSESEELITETLGGSTGHESSDSHLLAFFQGRSGPSGAVADSSSLKSVAEFAAHARAYARHSFGLASHMQVLETSGSRGGQPSATLASSHRDRPGRRADSATSTIHH